MGGLGGCEPVISIRVNDKAKTQGGEGGGRSRAMGKKGERVGYVQGMNVIVAHLLKHVEEGTALRTFTI